MPSHNLVAVLEVSPNTLRFVKFTYGAPQRRLTPPKMRPLTFPVMGHLADAQLRAQEVSFDL
jgi:hypothetical protein